MKKKFRWGLGLLDLESPIIDEIHFKAETTGVGIGICINFPRISTWTYKRETGVGSTTAEPAVPVPGITPACRPGAVILWSYGDARI